MRASNRSIRFVISALVIAATVGCLIWLRTRPADAPAPEAAALLEPQAGTQALRNDEAGGQPATVDSVAPPKAVAPPLPLPESLPGERVLQHHELAGPTPNQRIQVEVVKADFKYPLLRRIATVESDPATGAQVVRARETMVADHILVKLKPGSTEQALEKLNKKFGARIRKRLRAPALYVVKIGRADAAAVPLAIARYRSEAQTVAYAEPDYIVQAIDGDALLPNDPSFTELWGLNNSGSGGGTADADIDAPEAWTITTGNASVLIGVIDTGIEYTHEDLAANIWVNPGEIPDNGLDDDGNGFVDDVHGWDFYNDDNDPKDDHFHGSHCAGTIGAVGNNGIGVTGVCWNVRLVPMKFLGSNGSGSTSDAIQAVYYATALGVDVTSNSWSGGGFSQALKDAIADAGTNGSLFVAAAGNSSRNTDASPAYPASYDNDNIISVAATDATDQLAGFSNYGALSVDLGAPGVGVLSCGLNNSYRLASGTSMATPHVAGVAGLLLSIQPGVAPEGIKSILLSSTDPSSALQGRTVSGGRLNAFAALAAASGPYLKRTNPSVVDDGTGGTSGNGNGIVSPGERLGLVIPLENVGGSLAQGVTATLQLAAPNPDVALVNTSAAYGDIPSHAVGAHAALYTFDLAAGASTPANLNFLLTARDSGGGTWTSSFTLTSYSVTSITGTVRRLDGAPLAGVQVVYAGPLTGTVTTAADGTYAVWGPDGTYGLYATKAGFVETESQIAAIPPAKTNLDFEFTTATISGTVSDLDTGEPLAGAVVGYGGPVSGSVTSASDGSFQVATALGRPVTLTLQASKPDTHGPSAPIAVNVPPDATGLNLRLPRSQYQFTDLGTLGGTSSQAFGVNEDGEVVGMSQIGNGSFRAFKWSAGVMSELTGGQEAYDLNEAGEIAGKFNGAYLWRPSGNVSLPGLKAPDINAVGQAIYYSSDKGYLWANGVSTDLGSLGGPTTPWALNDAGTVVGKAKVDYSTSAGYAFLWRDGTLTQIGDFSPVNINNLDQIVGYDVFISAVLYENGTLTHLSTEFAYESRAYAVNDGGDIVGYTEPNNLTNKRAVLWRGAQRFDLNDLSGVSNAGEWILREARDINNRGQIVGLATYYAPGDIHGVTRAFLLTPIDPVDNSPPLITSLTTTPDPVRLPGTALLQANASDDGLPVPPGKMTYTWSKASGPGTVTFAPNGSASSATTAATFSSAGTYSLRVSVSDGYESTEQSVTATVYSADVAPPLIVGASANGTPTRIRIQFDEEVLQATAETSGNYHVSNGAVVSLAQLQADNRSVDLTVTPLSPGVDYVVTVNNVQDRAFPPNTIAPDSTITFRYNDLPVAQDQGVATPEDTDLPITLQASDADTAGLVFRVVNAPQHGTLAGTPPNVVYSPDPDYFGSDAFTFVADDGELSLEAVGNTATVSIDILPVNDAPLAQARTLTVPVTMGSPVTLSATDVEGDPLTYEIVTPPGSGTLSGTAPDLTYTPNASFTGSDSFTFRAFDGSAYSNSATVSLTIKDGMLLGWGHGGSGRIGDGSDVNRLSPVLLPNPSTVVQVSGGADHTLCVTEDAQLWVWGENIRGQLGTGGGDSLIPVPLSGMADIVSACGGSSFSLVAKGNGEVWGWGLNLDGQLGNGTTSGAMGQSTPVRTQGIASAVSVACGGSFGFALLADGTVKAWGDNKFGQLGDGTTTQRLLPVSVSGLTDVLAIAAGGEHALALRSDGTVWSWGRNYYGQLGDGTKTDRWIPALVPGLANVVALAASKSAHTSFALKADGTLWVWGYNYVNWNTGVIGDLTSPTQVLGLTGVKAIAIGSDHALALTADGRIWTWGHNSVGQLGNGTTQDNSTPTPVANLGSVRALGVGRLHSFALVGHNAALPNTPPVAENQSLIVPEDQSTPVTLGASDAENDTLTFILKTLPAHGSVVIAGNLATYTPQAGYFGSDSFTFTANDGEFESNAATVTLNVANVNDQPVATADSGTITQGRTLTVAAAQGVLANDTDADGDSLSAQLVSGPSHGSLTLDADGAFDYTPDTLYEGVDTFTYRAFDGQLASAEAIVSITVVPNAAPAAQGEDYRVNIDRILVIGAPAGVLHNDSDANGDPLTATLASSTTSGTLDLRPDGSFTYTAASGFTGADSFTYRVGDGLVFSATVTCTITVRPVTINPGAKVQYVKLAELHEPAPGVAGKTIQWLNPPQINNDGEVLIDAYLHLEGSSITSDQALWVRAPNGSMALRARANDPAPGTAGQSFKQFTPILGENGRIGLYGELLGAGTSGLTGLWISGPGGMQLVTKDEPAPGFADERLIDLRLFSISASGLSLTSLLIESQRSLLYTPDAGGQLPVSILGGADAPGTAGAHFLNFSNASNSVNPVQVAPSGFFAYGARLEQGTGDATAANDAGLWTQNGPGASLALRIRTGDPAPGLPSKRLTRGFSTPSANATGAIAYKTYLDLGNSSEDLSHDEVIVAPHKDGSDVIVVREGDPAPMFASSLGAVPPGTPVINGRGEVAFMNGTHPESLWAHDGKAGEGGLKLVAQTDAEAPGTGGMPWKNIRGFAFNDRGDLLFMGMLDNLSQFGLWVYSAALDRILPVAIADFPYEVAPGDWRIVSRYPMVVALSHIEPRNSMSGIARPLNNAGQFAYTVAFTDGTMATFLGQIPGEEALPEARDDAYTMYKAQFLTVQAPGLLSNDNSPSGGTLSAQLVQAPGHGSLSLNPNGGFTYTPQSSYTGEDTFTYSISADGGPASAPATVHIHILPPTVYALQTVVLSGEPAPGFEPGATYDTFSERYGSIDDQGRIGFTAYVNGSGLSNLGIWTGVPGALNLDAYAGMAAPGTGGRPFVYFYVPALDGHGHMAITAYATNPNNPSFSSPGIWSNLHGPLAKFAFANDLLPGTPLDKRVDLVSSPFVSGLGELVGRAWFEASGNGAWLQNSGGHQKIAFADINGADPAPGAPGSQLFDGIGTTRITPSGLVVFSASTADSSSAFRGGIWKGRPGALQKVVGNNDSAPGMVGPTGDPFPAYFDLDFSRWAVNDAGTIAFAATGYVLGFPSDGLWVGTTPADLQILCQEGTQAPDTLPGVLFFRKAEPPRINASGTVAFLWEITAPGQNLSAGSALFMGTPGDFHMIAREGQQVPNGPAGLIITQMGHPHLNDLGQIVFDAKLAGSGVNVTNDRALFAWADGALQMIVRERDLLEVKPGDFRTVSSLSFDEAYSVESFAGGTSILSNQGETLFWARFTDDSEALIHLQLPAPPSNQPPVIDSLPWANPNPVFLPSSATLNVAASDPDDGPNVLTYAWSKLSGPGTVTFTPNSTATAYTSTASFATAGSYVLRVSVSDGTGSTYADVAVEVLPQPNQPPSVDAGPDQTVTIPTAALLLGSASDPDGDLLTTTWWQVDGPGVVTFADAASTSTTALFSAAGAYTLRLQADDGSVHMSDDITVTVNESVVGPVTVTLQDGLDGYDGTRDAYVYGWHHANNFGAAADLRSQMSATGFTFLVRFAIYQSEGGPVPDGSQIESATLEVYKSTAYNFTYEAHRVLKNWTEMELTWDKANSSTPWSVPGITGANTDIVSVADGAGSVPWSASWLTMDVTAGLQAFSAGETNNGWHIVGISGNNNLKKFWSREYATNPTLRPKLTITYLGAGGGDPINQPPVADDLSISTYEEVAVGVTLAATDADGDALSYVVESSPANGTLTGAAPNLTYTPNANFHGGDAFTFRTNDGTEDGNVATVSITVNSVNDAPVAQSQSVSTGEDVAAGVTLSASDVDGDSLAYLVVVNPSNGTLNGTAPNLTYTPNANFHGSDAFTFKANDGTADSNVATISISVSSVNDAPFAQNQGVSTNEDVAVGFTLSATDADGDPLAYTVMSNPLDGTLSGTAPNLTYTPNANFHGSDAFTFRTNDGTEDGNVATVSITVNSVNDAPVAQSQSVSTGEDVAVGVTLSASDVDGDSLAYLVVANPSNGTLNGTAPNLTYAPNPDFHGSDAFTFKANDGTADSNVATISITVSSANDAPVVDAGLDQSVTLPNAALLLGSAGDPDGDVLSVTWWQISGPGAVTFADADSDTTTATFSEAGVYMLRLQAADGSMTVSDDVTVTVNDSVVGPVSITLQDGQDGYEGTRDGYVYGWHHTINFGASPELRSQLSATGFTFLVRFAIFQSEGGPVPDGAHIDSATLEVYKSSAYNYTYEAHRVLKDWKEMELTWDRASASTPWTVPGITGSDTDIASTADGSGSVAWSASWLTMDVTTGLQAFASGTANNGWHIVGISGNNNLKKFCSREYTGDPTLRPKLTVKYSMP